VCRRRRRVPKLRLKTWSATELHGQSSARTRPSTRSVRAWVPCWLQSLPYPPSAGCSWVTLTFDLYLTQIGWHAGTIALVSPADFNLPHVVGSSTSVVFLVCCKVRPLVFLQCLPVSRNTTSSCMYTMRHCCCFCSNSCFGVCWCVCASGLLWRGYRLISTDTTYIFYGMCGGPVQI